VFEDEEAIFDRLKGRDQDPAEESVNEDDLLHGETLGCGLFNIRDEPS
jgi:hypothetical protein